MYNKKCIGVSENESGIFLFYIKLQYKTENIQRLCYFLTYNGKVLIANLFDKLLSNERPIALSTSFRVYLDFKKSSIAANDVAAKLKIQTIP